MLGRILMIWLCTTTLLWAETIPDPIRVDFQRTRTGFVVQYRNTIPVPVTLRVEPQLTNIFGPKEGELLFVVPAYGLSASLRFFVQNGRVESKFKLPYRYAYGDYRVKESSVAYELPWVNGGRYRSSQAYHGALSHFGNQSYAIDFPMEEGTVVHASREGYAVEVAEEWTESGTSPELRERCNRVLIAHKDGTLARYQHFKTHGVVVRPGQWIRRGQVLGYSGDVGFSTGPHLHLDINHPSRELTLETLPFQLVNAGRIEEPRSNTMYHKYEPR